MGNEKSKEKGVPGEYKVMGSGLHLNGIKYEEGATVKLTAAEHVELKGKLRLTKVKGGG